MKMREKISRTLLNSIFLWLTCSTTVADDTEIFLKRSALSAEEQRPNLIFVLDTSGSMGLPIKNYYYDQEKINYDASIKYDSSDNYSGGAGDDDYYYLYERPYAYTYAYQYIYYNRVHKNQMACAIGSPYGRYNYFVYQTGANWVSDRSKNSSSHMCAEKNLSCGFTSGPNAPLVDCYTESKYIRYRSSIGNYADPVLMPVSANFHNYLQQYYRFTILQTVMRDFFDENYDINISLMRFNSSNNGAYVFHESILAEDPDDPTDSNQRSLRNAIDNTHYYGGTPLTESLWEAYLYLDGLKEEYGDESYNDTPPLATAAYSQVGTYKSPIEYECQKNYIILMTDGEPTGDNGQNRNIKNLTGKTCSGNCLDELAGWIRTDKGETRDHSNRLEPLTQSAVIHTIGFGSSIDATLLKNTASNGGGAYYAASSADDLLTAFKELAQQALFEKDTFVAPAVAVNSYSGLQHRDELYYALFQPTASPRWAGNIKKYTLKEGRIVDANNNSAINDSSGFFNNRAISYWTSPTNWDGEDHDGDGDTRDREPDGSQITYGGFGYKLTNPNARRLYTYTGLPLNNNGSTPTPQTLSREQLITSNTDITTSLLGLGSSDADSEAARIDIITWARGGDLDNPSPNYETPNYYVSDFIHNRPAVVTYRTTVINNADGTEDVTFDDTVFAASNMGFLHAIDTDTGDEEFAFIPRELLQNLGSYYFDSGGFREKVYGLDAPMTVWRNDSDGNGSIVTRGGTVETGNHVYLYQAMRRGGSHIYALDVSDRNAAKLMWQIDGSAYNAKPLGDYRDLAQTWSTPQKAVIRQWNCTSTPANPDKCDHTVLFFGGGYDTVHDSATKPTDGDKGNAIYMVDAITGALLWSAGNGSHHDLNLNEMENSIPAEVNVADVDGDGFVDFLFAIDIQGNLWRIDFDDAASSASTFAHGGKIAELGGSGNDFRRFFNAPDVAYFTKRGTAPRLTISVASGYRASPNETEINDHLFVIYDSNALFRPIDENGIASYDYVDNTAVIDISKLSNTSNSSSPPSEHGWYMPLSAVGEKGLSRTVTFNGQVLMTTFQPSIAVECEGAEGSGRYYVLDLFSGDSLLNDNLSFISLKHGGIPPEPSIIFSVKKHCVANCDSSNPTFEERSDLTLCVGTECLDNELDQRIQKSYWREN